MAEAMDDFFAKRDKKKSKKKFDTSDDVAKVLAERSKQKKELETGKSNYLAEGRQSPGPGLPVGGDDEWLEAEEKKPDFSNLKIQELVLTSDDEDDARQEGKENEDGSAEGPWKKKTQSKAVEEEKETPKEPESEEPAKEGNADEEKVEKDEDKPESVGGGESDGSSKEVKKENDDQPKKYVPPSLLKRQQEAAAAPPAPAPAPCFGSAAGGAYVPPSRRGGYEASGLSLAPMKIKKGAPTLEDEDSFPTLS